MSKVELLAAVRRGSRAGMFGRAIATKYRVSRHTVSDALASAWPRERKPLPPRASVLDPFKSVIDDIFRADPDAPRKQRHTVKRIYDRLIDEHGMHGVSYQVVRGYVAERKPTIRAEASRGPVNVFLPQTHRPGEEAEVDSGEVAINLRGEPRTCMFVLAATVVLRQGGAPDLHIGRHRGVPGRPRPRTTYPWSEPQPGPPPRPPHRGVSGARPRSRNGEEAPICAFRR